MPDMDANPAAINPQTFVINFAKESLPPPTEQELAKKARHALASKRSREKAKAKKEAANSRKHNGNRGDGEGSRNRRVRESSKTTEITHAKEAILLTVPDSNPVEKLMEAAMNVLRNTVSVNLSANESAENQPVNARAREDEDRCDLGTFTLSGKQVPDAECIQVRNWRYKLQKVFLSGNASPEYESMQEMDVLFTTVERHNNMTVEQMEFSKIGKVMRLISAIPDDTAPAFDIEYRFRARAKGLVERWYQMLVALSDEANRVEG